MKKEWQQKWPKAQCVVKPIFLNKEIGVKMQIINRDNELLFQTKQTGKNGEEAYTKAMNECLNKFDGLDLSEFIWYNPYMMECHDVKVPHYESKKV